MSLMEEITSKEEIQKDVIDWSNYICDMYDKLIKDRIRKTSIKNELKDYSELYDALVIAESNYIEIMKILKEMAQKKELNELILSLDLLSKLSKKSLDVLNIKLWFEYRENNASDENGEYLIIDDVRDQLADRFFEVGRFANRIKQSIIKINDKSES